MKIILILAFFTENINAHSYLHSPALGLRSKPCSGSGDKSCIHDQKQKETCGTGSSPQSNVKTYKRGESVEFSYPRNNHVGGFVRLAIVPFTSNPSQESFNSNIFHFNCKDTGCRHPAKGYEGDDDKGAFNFNICSSSFTVPSNLADGKYTIQWGEYGAFDNKFEKSGHSGAKDSYRSCLDIAVKDGHALSKSPVCASAVSCVGYSVNGNPQFLAGVEGKQGKIVPSMSTGGGKCEAAKGKEEKTDVDGKKGKEEKKEEEKKGKDGKSENEKKGSDGKKSDKNGKPDPKSKNPKRKRRSVNPIQIHEDHLN